MGHRPTEAHPSGSITRRRLGRLGLGVGLGLAGLQAADAQARSSKSGDVLEGLDAVGVAAAIRRGDFTAHDAAQASLARIAAANAEIGAVVAVLAPRPQRPDAVDSTGPLFGAPVLVKDLLPVRGAPTRMGSRATPDTPSSQQSPFVDALQSAGLVIVGKSQTPEFGGSPTTEPLLGPITRNPWNLGYSAGGSSGGSAAAVAAGFVPIAHGSDGGGSIRMPASSCGLVGLKVSRGRMIPDGSPPAANRLSVQGCLSRSVRDTATYLSLFEQHGPGAALPPVGLVSGPSRRRLRIGFNPIGLGGEGPDAEVLAAVEKTAALCRALGHEVVDSRWSFDGPTLNRALETSMLLAMVMLVGRFAQAKGVALEDSGAEPLHVRMAQAGAALPPGTAEACDQAFTEAEARYPEAFEKLDVVLTPTLARPPAAIGTLDAPDRPLEEILAGYTRYSGYTAVQNVAGAVGISLPAGVSALGLPIGAHFAATRGAERTLLELAYEIEAAAPWTYPHLPRGPA